MRRYLITGGAGFIGSAVVRRALREADCHVMVVDKLTYAGNRETLAASAGHPRFSFRENDIADIAAMRQVFSEFSPDVVLHLAAETHVDRSIDSPAEFIQTNIFGTYVLLDVALAFWRQLPPIRRNHFRFHHVSTDEVFGSLGARGSFQEDSPYQPRSPYAASKASADHLVRAWHHTYGLPVVLTNCSNNYGPYHFPEKLIPLMIINGLEGEPMPIYGNGQQIRDWLHVDDHADALLLVANQGRVGESYNIGARAEMSNLQVARSICDILDDLLLPTSTRARRNQIMFVADRPGHDTRYAIDPGKIEKELGWKARTKFSEGLRVTVEWYLANREWWEPLREKRYPGHRLGLASQTNTTSDAVQC